MNELLLIATIGGERIAFPARDVESVVEIEAITPVPRSAPHVAGLAALRSRVLTVIDCFAALGLPAAASRPLYDALVVQQDGHAYALIVDSVEDVVEFSGEVQPLRMSVGPGWQRVAGGVVEAGGELLLLAEPKALLAGPPAVAA